MRPIRRRGAAFHDRPEQPVLNGHLSHYSACEAAPATPTILKGGKP